MSIFQEIHGDTLINLNKIILYLSNMFREHTDFIFKPKVKNVEYC